MLFAELPEDHDKPWGLKGWTAEYKQIGPITWVYSIRDPKGNLWFKANQTEFEVLADNLDALIPQMEEKARTFASAYARKYSEPTVYSFDNPKPPFPGKK